MLVPKQLGEIARVASKDPARGAIRNVHIERDDLGKPYGVAVDGRLVADAEQVAGVRLETAGSAVPLLPWRV